MNYEPFNQLRATSEELFSDFNPSGGKSIKNESIMQNKPNLVRRRRIANEHNPLPRKPLRKIYPPSFVAGKPKQTQTNPKLEQSRRSAAVRRTVGGAGRIQRQKNAILINQMSKLGGKNSSASLYCRPNFLEGSNILTVFLPACFAV